VTVNEEELTPPVSSDDHIAGANHPKVTLVQYGDYECRYTVASHWQIELLLKNFAKEFRFVFRHFPLVKRHRFAERAAEAVEVAGAQGKFWEMHRALLKQDYNLGWEGLREAAKALNLDVPRFEEELLNHAYRRKIQEQVNSGIRSGVGSTPTYFVNGAFYDGPDNYDDFVAVIRKVAAGNRKRGVADGKANYLDNRR
jgi:protein-disulfide isomerase